jgi:hypothetical protein
MDFGETESAPVDGQESNRIPSVKRTALVLRDGGALGAY